MKTQSRKIAAIFSSILILGAFVLSSWHLAYAESSDMNTSLSDTVDTATAYLFTSDTVETDSSTTVGLQALLSGCDTTKEDKESKLIAMLNFKSDTTDTLSVAQYSLRLSNDSTEKDTTSLAASYNLLALND